MVVSTTCSSRAGMRTPELTKTRPSSPGPTVTAQGTPEWTPTPRRTNEEVRVRRCMTGSNHPAFTVVIPARWGSTRLPGKVLADLGGEPVLAWVVKVARAAGAERVVVAADTPAIVDAARDAGAEAVLTGEYVSGTDRVAAVASTWAPDLRVLNLQADAPLLDPKTVIAVARALDDPDVDIATASLALKPGEQDDPDVVKVRGRTFSRTPLPGGRRHLGIYGFRNAALQRLAAAAPTESERRERLEQLRALAIGLRFAVVPTEGRDGPDVDTPADLATVRARVAIGRNRIDLTSPGSDSPPSSRGANLTPSPQEPST